MTEISVCERYRDVFTTETDKKKCASALSRMLEDNWTGYELPLDMDS